MSIRCGNTKVHGKAKDVGALHHQSVAQVRECFATEGGLPTIEEEEQQYQDYLSEVDPDAAYERHLENLGWEEAALQDRMEAEAVVISFEDAMANAERAEQARRVRLGLDDEPDANPSDDQEDYARRQQARYAR
jgi:hypothetical protein